MPGQMQYHQKMRPEDGGQIPRSSIEGDQVLMPQAARPRARVKWQEYCADSLASLGMRTVDEFIDEVRGH